MKNLIKSMRILFPFIKKHLFSYTIGIIIYSSQSFIFSFLTALYLNKLSDAIINGTSNSIIFSTINYIIQFTLYLLILSLGTYYSNIAIMKITREVKKKIYQHYLFLNIESPTMINNNPVASINTDADLAMSLLNNPISRLLSCVISITLSSMSIFIINQRIGIFALLIGISSFLIQLLFTKPLAINEKKRLKKNNKIIQTMMNILQNIMTIKAFNLQDREKVEMSKDNKEYLTLSYKEAMISTWQNLFMTFQGWLSLVGTFIFGSYLVSNNLITFSSLIMIPSLCNNLADGMGNIGYSYSSMQAPIQAVFRIEELLKDTLPFKKEIVSIPWNHSYQLNVSNLNFSYQNQPKRILSNINLTIKENTINVFIGASGSGKSTLLKVIMGLYERNDIAITCGNLENVKTSKKRWNQKFAYIDQSYQLFDMSIEENIKLSNPSSTHEQIINAAKKANAYDFIMKQENQFDTRITENGGNLSGGQLQRIAIARALNKEAPILLFDEPTSALDEESSKEIIKTIENLSRNHTILLVTHQLEVLPKNSIIYYVEEGTIKEIGYHDDLIKKQEYYYHYLNAM